ncbi:ankyrin-1-like [Malaya genurostris]|uniref:ankyrin-1-like n=1 Tax=Malaya genurostris TaxID=325434 RepID=UPI0026F3D512|nr:ankyrin-1-like [Malaya genurostris]
MDELTVDGPVGGSSEHQVLIACKNNDLKSLKNLESRILQNFKPASCDHENHTAFYYAIRSGNDELLKTLIEICSSEPNYSRTMDDLLSGAYEDLKLKQIPLTCEMEYSVVKKLIDLRCQPMANESKSGLDKPARRIAMLKNHPEQLFEHYSSDDVEVDGKFLYLCRIIMQNIQVLQVEKLESPCNLVPWEQLKFLLYAFKSSCTEKDEISFVYNAVLDKKRLLEHLKNSYQILCLTGLPANKSEGTEFGELCTDYTQMKDIYSLERIAYYIRQALTDSENSYFATKRALQVMGEYVKDSKATPHLSASVHITLFDTFDKDLKKCIESLRDKLSHAANIYVLEKRQSQSRSDFKNSLNKLLSVVQDVLVERKLQMVMMVLNKVITGSMRQSELARIIKYSVLEMLMLDILTYMEANLSLFDSGARSVISCLDRNAPLLIAKQMRNHLAHGNVLFQILPTAPSLALIGNARKIMELKPKDLKPGGGKITQPLKPFDEWEKDVMKCLAALDNQQNMFTNAEQGNLEEVLKCIENGADKTARDFKLWNILHYAAKGGRANIFEHFEDDDRPVHFLESKDRDGNRPIHIAAQFGHGHLLEFFVPYDLIEVKQNDGCTPMHVAAQNKHPNLVENLVKKGAKIDTPTNDGWLPIHFAAQNGAVEVIKTLLNECADLKKYVNAKDNYEWAPLHLAVLGEWTSAVSVLLKNGAEINDTGPDTWTSLHLAVHNGHGEMIKILLENNADINATIDEHFTALHVAAQNGHTEVVTILLNLGAYNKAAESSNFTPLCFAAQNGHAEVVRLLLDKDPEQINSVTAFRSAVKNGHETVVTIMIGDGADFNALENDKSTALHVAAENGQEGVVRILLDNKALVDAETDDGTTPLYLAALNGHCGVVEFLLSKQAKVDVSRTNNYTALSAAVEDGHEDVVEVLLKNKASVDAVHLVPALHFAVARGYKVVIKYLLEKGADIESKYIMNNTPLHYALMYRQTAVVKMLLENKANVNAVNDKHFSPLFIAIRHRLTEVVTDLLNRGADVNARLPDNSTPLHYAAFLGYTDGVVALLNGKADIEAINCDEYTPLHVATQYKHIEVVELLLNRDANVNSETINKRTPLHVAAGYDFKEVVDMLLDKGAEINAKDKHKWTALNIAQHYGHIEVMSKLLEKNADRSTKSKLTQTPFGFDDEQNHGIRFTSRKKM